MEEANLKQVIQNGESENVEFKESLKLVKEIAQSICAFANTSGGIVCIGISDKGKIIGADIGANTIENLANHIRNNTDSQLYPSINVEEIQNKNIVVLEVKEAKEKPVFYKKHAYKRIGKTNPELSSAELRRIAKESGEKEYFDERVCEGASLEDIDEKAADLFKMKCFKVTGKEIISSNIELLKLFKCIKEVNGHIKPTNAGVLLFGKDPAEFFPRYYISIVRYPGNDIGTAYLDIIDIEGNLFDQIDHAEEYINEHIEALYRLKEGQVARERVPQYPEFVIRELIANAVAHRDYCIRGSKTIIKMYKDRIEFDSPGGFGGNVNEKNILTEQYS
ncbi:MAG: putative DNA binding domain-containing protein [Candidatus Aenigmarchaeota archaeon]|nr:putative DNA binding domain-containing protein [Candidatus Aenigmarchaeota archaeon]